MIISGNQSVLVQGITGQQGTFWTEHMRNYGTNIIGGVNPRKAGTEHLGLPVWESAVSAAASKTVDASILFIPPLGVKAAVLDAISAGIKKIVVLTEHIPVQDVMYFLCEAADAGVQIVGPNTAGLVSPGESMVGFMPAFNHRIFKPGSIGVISRSGSLGTLVCLNLVREGLGISHFIGIGGDPIIGTTTKDALIALDNDPKTRAVALVGEIGGTMEEEAAEFARTMNKPIACFIAGAASPPGKKMGHAGAIVMGERGSFTSKKKALTAAGVSVHPTPDGVSRALRSLTT